MTTINLSVREALSAPSFGKGLPPLSDEAKLLLGLSGDERENPKVLALIAQKDPVFCGRLMSLANSANYAHKGLTSSMDGAVRRLGVETTYTTLVACAMSDAFNSPNLTKDLRNFLLKYTLSLTITARKLASWLDLPEEQGNALWLSALLYPCGLFAGVTSGLALEQHYLQGLTRVIEGGALNLPEAPELEGFLTLSAAVGETWQMPQCILDSLIDCDQAQPQTAAGAVLKTCALMVAQKRSQADETPLLQDLFEKGFSSQETSRNTFISMAFLLV